MATGRINKTTVSAAAPTAKDWLLWDDRLLGFGLKVTVKGGKVFVFQYRLGGRGAKVRRYTIGRFGKLTVEAAREIAEGLARKVAEGVDPQMQKVEQARRQVDLAFGTYIERFRDDCLKKEWKATHKYAYSLLTTHALPKLGSKALCDISRKDVKEVLAPVLGKAATASNVFAVMRRLFSWALEHEDIERSPLEGMRPPPLPSSRDRVLSDEELSLVWEGAGRLGYPFGPMVQLLILTGARREEVAGMDWAELNRTGRVWSLPAARSKNATAAEQPLSDMAVTVLDGLAKRVKLKEGWPKAGFIFSTTGETSVSGFSRAKQRLDKEIGKIAATTKIQPPQPWRLHDLRRTLATGMQKLGVRLEVTEAVLNHVSGSRSGVVGIYQRYNWMDEKRVALADWAAHVQILTSGAATSKVAKNLEV